MEVRNERKRRKRSSFCPKQTCTSSAQLSSGKHLPRTVSRRGEAAIPVIKCAEHGKDFLLSEFSNPFLKAMPKEILLFVPGWVLGSASLAEQGRGGKEPSQGCFPNGNQLHILLSNKKNVLLDCSSSPKIISQNTIIHPGIRSVELVKRQKTRMKQHNYFYSFFFFPSLCYFPK